LGPDKVLTYHLHIVNTGPVNLSGVTVYDQLPWQTTTYQRDAMASAGQIISDIVSFQWSGDVAAFSAEVLTFTVLVDRNFVGTLTNTATISHPRLLEPVIAQAVAQVIMDRPVWHLSKAAWPESVETGHLLTYTLHLYNSGLRATGVVVADEIPRNAEYVPGSATAGGEFIAGKVRWQIPRLETFESRTFQFQVTAGEGWWVRNRHYWVASAEGVVTEGDPVRTTIVDGIGSIYLPIILRNGP
jgi:uncharacterized repeat protein (TIGR01451 family)